MNRIENLAIDSSGKVYVADTHNHRVQKFSSDGSFITKWGNNPIFSDNFGPVGIAVDCSGVYVTDLMGHGVQKFSSNGSFITNVGSAGADIHGHVVGPQAVDVDSSGNVYVTDYAAVGHFKSSSFSGNKPINRIQEFSPGPSSVSGYH